MSPLPRLLRVLLPAVLCMLAAPGAAFGHTELVATDPPDGSAITTPYTARATFSEPLEAERSRVDVRDAAGNIVAEGEVDPGAAETIVVALPPLEPGTYRARWVAVGADGHVVRTTTQFSIEATATAPPATPSPAPTPATSGGPTAGPTATPPAAPTPSPPPPVASTPPPGQDGQPTAGTADLLIALLVAALIVAAVFAVLGRRRPA